MFILSIEFHKALSDRNPLMPKFYVSSGNFQLVIEANHPRAAAIWAVHRCLATVAPFLSEHDKENTIDSHAPRGELSYQAAEPQRRLGETLQISERGFGGEDQQELATLPIVAEWSRLLVALDKLQQQLQGPSAEQAAA
jgi:hypothetical protein